MTKREQFLEYPEWKTQPPVISKSAFVPDSLVEHLLRGKSPEKADQPASITRMEAFFHAFVNPIGKVTYVENYVFNNPLVAELFSEGGGARSF